jgi:hypothetical protein
MGIFFVLLTMTRIAVTAFERCLLREGRLDN